jgi:hypothetical protein
MRAIGADLPGRGQMPACRALALGVLVALAGMIATVAPSWPALEEDVGLAYLFRLRGPLAAPPDVVVVAIDPPSARALGQSVKPSEWPRTPRTLRTVGFHEVLAAAERGAAGAAWLRETFAGQAVFVGFLAAGGAVSFRAGGCTSLKQREGSKKRAGRPGPALESPAAHKP